MPTKKMHPRSLLPGRIWKGSQSWQYEAIWTVRGWVVRIHIDRDSYDFQSSLTVDLLDSRSGAWNRLLWRPVAGSATAKTSAHDSKAPLDAFRADETVLLTEADALLGALR